MKHPLNSGLRSVEYPFITFDDVNGVFYAELLCMEYPIAGFVFDTLSDTDVRGRWFGPEIQPMDEYSHHGAMERIDKYLPDRNKSEEEPEEDEFYEALERFIASELEEMEDSGNL